MTPSTNRVIDIDQYLNVESVPHLWNCEFKIRCQEALSGSMSFWQLQFIFIYLYHLDSYTPFFTPMETKSIFNIVLFSFYHHNNTLTAQPKVTQQAFITDGGGELMCVSNILPI